MEAGNDAPRVGIARGLGRRNVPRALATADGPEPDSARARRTVRHGAVAPTVSALAERGDFSGRAARRSAATARVRLLSPVDLQCVKACGVTFRGLGDRAGNRGARARRLVGRSRHRERLEGRIGGSIRAVEPGSAAAASLKDALIEDGLWSQYLEVAIGPDAEVFTKSRCSPPSAPTPRSACARIRPGTTPSPKSRCWSIPAAPRSARRWATT
jgi:hypothetical protein